MMPLPDDDAAPDRVERPPFDVEALSMYTEPIAFGSPPPVAIELVGEVPWELREDAVDGPALGSGLTAVLREARLRMYRPEEWEIRTGRERAYGAEMTCFELLNTSSGASVRIHEQRLGYWISSRVPEGELVLPLGRSRRIGGGTLPIMIAKLAARDFTRSGSSVRVTVGRKSFVFDVDQQSAAG
ncbi:MAG TPA: hypothetical protein VFQ74_05715 [Pseudolysinimonas sp.]|nr:hypothetical protein [Pseudolysinimonas sp.]